MSTITATLRKTTAIALLPIATLLLTVPAHATSNIAGQWLIKQKGDTATVTIRPVGNRFVGTITQGKKYVGETVITSLTLAKDGKYSNGTIIDPTNGKKYQLNAEVKGNTLQLRGFVGSPLLGATQTWYRK